MACVPRHAAQCIPDATLYDLRDFAPCTCGMDHISPSSCSVRLSTAPSLPLYVRSIDASESAGVGVDKPALLPTNMCMASLPVFNLGIPGLRLLRKKLSKSGLMSFSVNNSTSFICGYIMRNMVLLQKEGFL